MSLCRSAWSAGSGIVLVALCAVHEAGADSLDRAQLGVGMGAVGAVVGAAAGPAGSLVGGVVGAGIGSKLADDPRYNPGQDPDAQRALEAERAAWLAERRSSEERLRDEQRAAFETRTATSSGRDTLAQAPPEAGALPDPLVQQIQRGLARVGYQPGSLDGTLGPSTVAAIEAYQREHRLPVNGEPSTDLLVHIRRAGG